MSDRSEDRDGPPSADQGDEEGSDFESASEGMLSSGPENRTVGGPLQLETLPYDPEPAREKIRAILALILVGCVAAEIAFLILALVFGWLDISGAKEFAGFVLTPTLSLAGAATGFYYGVRSR